MRRPTSANNAVSLFPFLAVLLCTMGSLVLLLMLIASQAKAQAEAERAEAAKPKFDVEAIKRREDDLQWKIDQLTKSREQTIADVAETRSQLSHLEEHAARLKQQLADLEAAEALLKSQASADGEGRAAVAADLAELRRKIAEAEKKLAAEKQAGRKPQAFAVVPYDGDKGTRRRPIYIECRGDAIILQPEGIRFVESDFAGSLGPSNPLAVAVRLVSEYLTRGETYKEGEQPYPLLLVRPSGIGAYYVARSGMSSWEGEFGYELIDESWPLEFPPADPLLAQMTTKAVEEARIRQVMMARAAPSLRGKNPKATFRVAPSGRGIVQEDGGDGAGYGSRDARYSANRGPRGGSGNGAPGSGGPRTGGGYSSERPSNERFASINGGAGGGQTIGGNGGAGPGSGDDQPMPPGIGQGLDGTNASNSAGGLVAAAPQLGGGAPSDNRYGGTGYGSGAGNGTGPGVGPAGELVPAGTPSGVPGTTAGVGGPTDGSAGPSLGAPTGGSGAAGMPAAGGANSYVGSGAGGMSAGDANRYPQANQYGSTGSGTGNGAGTPPPPGSMSNGYSSVRPTGDSNDGATSGPGGLAQAGGAGASGSGSNATSGVAGTGGGQPGDSASGSASAGGSSAGGSPSFGAMGQPSGGQPGGGQSGASGDPSQAPNASVTQEFKETGPGEYVESMASKRGKNWGLPEEARRSTPLTRPIQIYCSGNQLTILSDKGIPDKQIVMEGPTENSVDTLVSNVWDQVTTWGIAGRGMYWKPKLVVHVSPDGAQRFNDLKQLLEGSGLEVSGKQIAVAQPVAGRR